MPLTWLTGDLESDRYNRYRVHLKCTENALDQKYGEFEFFKVTFTRKPSWPCGGHVTSTGLFFDFAKKKTKMVDLPIEPNWPTQQEYRSKTNQTGGIFWTLFFLGIWPQKMVKKLIHWKTPDLLSLCSFSYDGHAGPFLLIIQNPNIITNNTISQKFLKLKIRTF